MIIYMATSESKAHIKTLSEMNQEEVLLTYLAFYNNKKKKGLADVFGENTIFAGPETSTAGAGIPRDRRG
jgi:hypothetical protein